MNDKKIKIDKNKIAKIKDEKDKESIKTQSELEILIHKKINFFKEIIQKTLIHIQQSKYYDVLAISDVTYCLDKLENINKKIDDTVSLIDINNSDNVINHLQLINNELSALLKSYGTMNLDDLLCICFGNNKLYYTEEETLKFKLLQKYFHPTGYKVFNKKENKKEFKKESTVTKTENKKNDKEEDINKKMSNVSCLEVDDDGGKTPFHMKVYGIKTYFYDDTIDKGLIIYGIIDDIMVDFCNNEFIQKKKKEIYDNIPSEFLTQKDTFHYFIESLILKDYLIYTCKEIYQHFSGYISQIAKIKQTTIPQKIKEFLSAEMFTKRIYLLHLLMSRENYENQYFAYILYDLLSSDVNGSVDTQEQITIFNSFPWFIKKQFFESMKNTVQYANDLTTVNTNKIPLEQQISLMKCPEIVKEKAVLKLKEVKSKSEDSGTKARQYLEGLIKIPFGIYRKEPILNAMNNIKIKFKEFYKTHKINKLLPDISSKDSYTSIEIMKYIDTISTHYQPSNTPSSVNIKSKKNKIILTDLAGIQTDLTQIQKSISQITDIMNKSVHGHTNAKKQIERIIGQWINGDHESGYCIGFEGPPGVGKTTLAKVGLSNILKDTDGSNRPFALIQLGGESSGSTLHGHNYTYVGSTWGSIVQILMDKKCMNPIILIDEVDKISKTEQGKEIIGILTHLLDQTQNDCFQDKYFSGIDLDLSKALFILSYNDAQLIDKILLDRIHRIKFGNLTLEEKVYISIHYVMPEISKKFGLENMFEIDESVFKFIIQEYTNEPGIRKYKEILFEIIGEINLDILKNGVSYDLPIKISIEDIKNKYFKDKHEMKHKKIHASSEVGVINALWANGIGQGGVLPLQVKFVPSNTFLELKLTGSLGDVMKESINVSLTTAWNLTTPSVQAELIKKYNDIKNNKVYGIHVHCPDCATPKDGPSATTAFTVIIYSIFNNLKIKNYFGITGETSFDYQLTEIGGLEQKILGGIQAGITEFIYPTENAKDFMLFMDKYKKNDVINGIQFHGVDTISKVLELIVDK